MDTSPVPPDPPPPPHAASAASWGYFLSADLSLDSLALTTGEIGLSRGTAPPDYEISHTANASVALPLFGVVSILNAEGTYFSSAASNVDGAVGDRFAEGIGEATTVLLSLIDLPDLPLLAIPPLLRVQASSVRSSSRVEGEPESLVPISTSSVASLQVSVLGAAYASISVTGAANQTVSLSSFGLGSITLIINEQAITAPSPNGAACDTAALHIKIESLNFLGVGPINGDIYLGHSGAIIGVEE